MAPGIDFTELSPSQVLDLAVAVEEEARERYLELADQMAIHHTGEAAGFFRKMADLESHHADRLRRRRAALPEAESAPADAVPDPVEVEAPEYFKVRAFMTVHDAVEAAVDAEKKAYRFYDDALEQVEVEDLRTLFGDLRAQEERHRELIEQFAATLPDRDRSDPADYVDEPRAL